ncbi:VENN motif pre-toxin domain-containing protein [Siccibacter turicensis]|uniref:VENN motif pre-toxin domain-containing protein n=1 Tax=Siccibacter turicensis TaxID=357233 RepID=UPI00046351F0|nr:VENN motif pre-toxin domain-containing protein [Siccibacter turicensis]
MQKEGRESARQAWEKLNPNKTATEQDVSQYLYDGFYNSALEKSEMGTGGSYQRAIQATTAIVQGLSAGNINAALAGAAAPYLANQIAQHIDKEDREARLIAHAVLGAALAAVQKQDIAAGAAGASIGELAGMIAVELKGGRAGELSEADKQTVSALATLASTLAGGLIGDSGATAVNAGLAGKNAVENNSMSGDKARQSVKESAEWWKEQVRGKLGENIVSQMANGLVNLASETGDFAMLGGDTAFDLVAALTACATGDSYCSQAKSDIAKKDAAAATMLNGIMNGDAWGGIKSTVVKAWNGDQKALENVAGTISVALIPAKGLPGGKSVSTISPGKGTVTSVANKVTGSSREQVAKNGSWDAIDAASKTAFNSAKNDVANWTPKDKHMIGTSASRSAQFNTNSLEEIRTLVKDALNSPDALFLPNNQPGSFRVVADLGMPIGTKGQTSVRIIVGEDGKIWNAFPVNVK